MAFFLCKKYTFIYCGELCVLTRWLLVAPADQCKPLQYASSVFTMFALSAASYLFLLRARAICNDSKIAITCFGFLWVTLLGLCILLVVSDKAGKTSALSSCAPQNSTFHLHSARRLHGTLCFRNFIELQRSTQYTLSALRHPGLPRDIISCGFLYYI